jgi:two-component system, LuxR family, response regulator FixJ
MCPRGVAVLDERPTIFIVDADVSALSNYRQDLCNLMACFKTFTSARAFLENYSPSSSQCLICDFQDPDLGGLQVQKTLAEKGSNLPIIFVSAHSHVACVVEAIKGGAFDFLERPVNSVNLLQKVKSALEHSRKLYAENCDTYARKAKLALLSRRERQIADQVALGLSSREISEMLALSVRTVENHRARIVQKLGITSTVDLVRLLVLSK